MKRWIISDTHFGHENIIKYEKRPYVNAKHMDLFLIANWNKKVKNSDKVFHLGDFAFGNKEYIKSIVAQLNGDIFLIIGNHDYKKADKWWFEVGIKNVYRYPIILDNYYILSHHPLYINSNMPYVNFHGHTHSLSFNSKQYINCSVEVTHYFPRDLDELIKDNFIKSNEEEEEEDIVYAYDSNGAKIARFIK